MCCEPVVKEKDGDFYNKVEEYQRFYDYYTAERLARNYFLDYHNTVFK